MERLPLLPVLPKLWNDQVVAVVMALEDLVLDVHQGRLSLKSVVTFSLSRIGSSLNIFILITFLLGYTCQSFTFAELFSPPPLSSRHCPYSLGSRA